MVLKNTVKMSHDIVADALNQIMNAKRAGHSSTSLKHSSRFLVSVLSIGKLRGYIENFRANGKQMDIDIGKNLNACCSIKPRYFAQADEIMKYVRRYLPSRHMGVVIVSTSKGLMTHHTAIEKGIGGSIIAYFY